MSPEEFRDRLAIMEGWPAWKLRRHFREIELSKPDWHTAAWWHRLVVMAAMSRTLPHKPIAIDKAYFPDGTNGMDRETVDKYEAMDEESPPVVVIGVHGVGPYEVCDGRHRVLAARSRGDVTIRAVFAAERMPKRSAA